MFSVVSVSCSTDSHLSPASLDKVARLNMLLRSLRAATVARRPDCDVGRTVPENGGVSSKSSVEPTDSSGREGSVASDPMAKELDLRLRRLPNPKRDALLLLERRPGLE